METAKREVEVQSSFLHKKKKVKNTFVSNFTRYLTRRKSGTKLNHTNPTIITILYVSQIKYIDDTHNIKSLELRMKRGKHKLIDVM